MWAGNIQLSLGNIFIGLLEGFLILLLVRSKIDAKTRIEKSAALWIMILANFVSALIGILLSELLTITGTLNYGININTSDLRLGLFLTGIILSLYLLTALIEWPFCHWVLKTLKYNGPMARTSLSVSLIVQCASYILLILMYYAASDITVFTRLNSDPSLSFVRNPKAEVYFISESDGNIYRINIDGTDKQRVFDTKTDDLKKTLFMSNPKGGKIWKLHIRHSKGAISTLILDNFGKVVPQMTDKDFGDDPEERWPQSEFHPIDLRLPDMRKWKVSIDFWAYEGVWAENKTSGKTLVIGLDTPFVEWKSRYATILPGDQVVYQLGEQIVILDLNSRKIGLIAYGRSPVVRLDKTYQ